MGLFIPIPAFYPNTLQPLALLFYMRDTYWGNGIASCYLTIEPCIAAIPCSQSFHLKLNRLNTLLLYLLWRAIFILIKERIPTRIVWKM